MAERSKDTAEYRQARHLGSAKGRLQPQWANGTHVARPGREEFSQARLVQAVTEVPEPVEA